MKIKVSITECYGDRRITVKTTATGDLDAAIESAISKGYGRARFYREHSISLGIDAMAGPQYGQIGRRSKDGANMITGRVCIRAEIVRAAK